MNILGIVYQLNQNSLIEDRKMANIKVKDLTSIAGSDLFNDLDSFMQDLSETELNIKGGSIITFIGGTSLSWLWLF
jgi:predicted HAD superfamily phosphohydrolase